MKGLLKRSLLIVGIFVFVWIPFIYSWRINNRLPNVSEITSSLIVLPIALIAILYLSGKLWRNGFALIQSRVETNTQEPLDDVREASDALERHNSIAVLASAIRSAHGNSPEELSIQLKLNEARISLDPELKDHNGFPILSSRISGIDENAQLNKMLSWAQLNKRESLAWTDEQLRAITLGSEVVIELMKQAVKHPLFDEYVTAQSKNLEVLEVPMLQLLALLPQSWKDEERSHVTDWFFHLIQDLGWPEERITFRPEILSLANRTMDSIDRLMLESFRSGHSFFTIVIACESHIGELTIQNWEAEGKLFDQRRRDTKIPGEGAAGLLLTDSIQAPLYELDTISRLHRVVQSRHNKSADSIGFIDDELMANIMQQALTLSKIPVEKITLISSDTDHRSSRLIELLSNGFKIFPDLDPDTQYFKLASNCGEMGAVTSLAALVLAHHKVITDSEAVLSISNNDGYERTSVVLSSWADSATLLTTST
ncbi:MAG: hypothetical protein H7252_03670 [Cytophaga sp.]|nr:hypothetical protein [Undibacterium sp.]